MNNKEVLSKATVTLLREELPGSAPRPGFETRLLHRIRSTADRPERRIFWIPLAAMTGAAALAFLALLTAPSAPDAPLQATVKPPVSVPDAPALDLGKLTTPLESEATAIRSSASRAGRFLINCLPSLPDPDDTL